MYPSTPRVASERAIAIGSRGATVSLATAAAAFCCSGPGGMEFITSQSSGAISAKQ